MRKHLLLLAVAVLFCMPLRAQDNITDSVDALHYDLRLDIGNHTPNRIEGSAAVTMHVLRTMDTVGLELCVSDIDSVLVDGIVVPFRYDYDSRTVRVPFGGNAGDTTTVTIFYRKGQYLAPQGWGGFYFDNNIYYNLGIALYEYPHNMGKSWYPCRDNFYDKATYHLAITARPGWKAICTGLMDTVYTNADESSTFEWTLNRQTPTYLVGVAVAPFHTIERTYEGEYGTYPALLGYLTHDSVGVWNAFDNMSRVIPMYERCFGPYRWDRVGYVSTPKGSMEHVGNVAFTTYCMALQDEACLATMSHEFSHSWFGNLLTCATSADMWINEGGASFCEEVAVQAIYAESDPLRYKEYAKENLLDVLTNAHISDDGFKPVYGQTPEYTYGKTVYDKGATVWHSLRGYVGDSVFYASLRRLFDRCAFQNIDSWQLRDSLSLYTGNDLTDFFNFHVFGAGFNDYRIDSLVFDRISAYVRICQTSYGTDSLANGNRVWVTFFSPLLRTAKRLVTFDGEYGEAVFQLPFKPVFAVVDYDDDLSKASIGEQRTIKAKGSYDCAPALFKAEVNKVEGNDSIWLYVKHHWTSPDTSLSPRYLRMADRYWDVKGIIPESARIGGRFYYSRLGSDAMLDNNLFTNSSEFEQVRLLYRENAESEWRPVSNMHTGSTSQGYFVLNSLKTGEYTLAMIDTNYVRMVTPAESNDSKIRVYPNPTTGDVTIETDTPGEPLVIDVSDISGTVIIKGLRMKSGDKSNFELKTGSYFFAVRQLRTNRLSSVKIQFMNF